MSQVRSSVFWCALASYSAFALQFTTTIVLARLLTPEEIGIFSVSMALTTIVASIREFGVANYLIQAPTVDKQTLRQSQAVCFAIAWPLAALIYGARDAVAAFYGEPGVARVMAVLAIVFLLMPIGLVARAMITRELQFKTLFVVQVSMVAMQAITAILTARYGAGYMSMAWGQLAAQLTTILVLAILRPRHVFLRPSFRGWLPVLTFGAYNSSTNCLMQAGIYVPDMIIGRLLGFGAVAYYTRALGLTGLYEMAIAAVVLPIAFPVFAAARHQGRDVTAGFLHALSLVTGFGLPFFACLGVLAEPIVLLLFGDPWRPAVPVLQILCVAFSLTTFTGLASQAIIAFGAVRENLIRTIIVQGTSVTLVAFASLHGIEAVAATQIASTVLGAVLSAHLLRQLFGLRAREIVGASLGSLKLAGAAATGAATLSFLAAADAAPVLAQALAGGAGAAGGWLVALFAFDHPAKREIQQVLRRRLPRRAVGLAGE